MDVKVSLPVALYGCRCNCCDAADGIGRDAGDRSRNEDFCLILQRICQGRKLILSPEYGEGSQTPTGGTVSRITA